MRRNRGRSPARSSRKRNERSHKQSGRRRSPPRSSKTSNRSRNAPSSSSRGKRSRNDNRREIKITTKRRKTEPSRGEYDAWAKTLSATEMLALLRTHCNWLTQYQSDISSMAHVARKRQLVRTVADEFYTKRLPLFDTKDVQKALHDALAADWCYARTPVELLCVLKYLKPDHKLIKVPIRDADTINLEDLQNEVFKATPKDTLPSKEQLEEVVKIIQDQESGAGLGHMKIPKKSSSRVVESKRGGGRGSEKRSGRGQEHSRKRSDRLSSRRTNVSSVSSRKRSPGSRGSMVKISSKPRGGRVSEKISSSHIRSDRAPPPRVVVDLRAPTPPKTKRPPPPTRTSRPPPPTRKSRPPPPTRTSRPPPPTMTSRPPPPTRTSRTTMPTSRPTAVTHVPPPRVTTHLPLSPRTMQPSQRASKPPPPLYQTNTNSRQTAQLQFRGAPPPQPKKHQQESQYTAYRPPTFPKPPTRSPGMIGMRPVSSPGMMNSTALNSPASRSHQSSSSSRKRGSEFYPSLPSFPQTEVVDDVFPPIHQPHHPRQIQPEPKTFFPPPPQRRSLYHETSSKPAHTPAIRPGASFHRVEHIQPPQPKKRYANPFYPSVGSMTMRAD